MEYKEFLKNKIVTAKKSGVDVSIGQISEVLLPHQRDLVQWALEGGRRAIFAAFGLGKTLIQLEIMRLLNLSVGGRQLIICPLGVKQEFVRDGKMLNMSMQFVRKSEQVTDDGLYLTNYESVRDGKLDVNLFNAASLDEASVLRSYGSKTYQNFLTLFTGVKYRFVATATPSPNKHKELIHYGGFLGIMDTGEALTRFFQRDSTKANHLTLYPHAEKEFWSWLSSWATFLQKPSDLGYSDEGYDLPPVKIHYHKVDSEESFTTDRKTGQRCYFQHKNLSLRDASAEKRSSLPTRISKMSEIIKDDPDSNYILWHDQEAERHAIKKAIPTAVEVFGSLDLEKREERIADFSDGKFQYLATKPILSGSGCNFQRFCHKAIYLGIGFKFNDFIQSYHRIYRFLQKEQCEVHIIYSEKEAGVLEVLKTKWEEHEEKVDIMTDLIKEHGLSNKSMIDELKRSIGVKRIAAKHSLFECVNNDCVEETNQMQENSVDLIVTSIPFSNHYEYTPSYNDFGHTTGNNHFWKQMDFLTPNLLKVLNPGRIYACHVKDRILFGNATGTGAPTVSPFHCEAIMHGIKHGFDFMGMITVVTDVVRENNQTYRLGWSEQCKDGTKMGVGSPEYICLFRKPQTDRSRGYADTPVKKTKDDYSRSRWQIDAHAFWRSSGDKLLTPEEMAQMPHKELHKAFTKQSLMSVYNYEDHVQIGEELDVTGCLPSSFMSLAPGSHAEYAWHDINRMLTLNGAQKRRNLNMHVCPLQTDIVDRLISRFSNKGDIVFDPFGGIMTVPYRAVTLDRIGKACELNHGYWLDGIKHCKAAAAKKTAPTLFDFLDNDLEKVT